MTSRSNKSAPAFNIQDPEATANLAKEVLRKMEENPGMSLKDATGIPDEVLEDIYHLAYTFYNQGKYKDASALFQLLSGTAPNNFKYIFGLASCYHQAECYEEAAVGFFIALKVDPENPLPAFYVTDCFLKQNHLEEALEFAEVTIAICGDKPEHSELSNRCKMIAESIKSKK